MGRKHRTQDASPPESRRDQIQARREAQPKMSFRDDTRAESTMAKIFGAVVTYVLLVLIVVQINGPNVDDVLECTNDPANHTDQECEALADSQDTIFLVLILAGIAVAIFVIFLVVREVKT